MIDQHSSLSEKFLKKGFWLYLFSFIIAPTGYVIKIIISGELSVNEVGIIYGIISLITLVAAFNDFGMTESINYFLPKFITEKRYDKVKNALFYAFLTQLLTGLIIAGLFFFGADFIAKNYFKSEAAAGVLKIFCLFFLGINIFQIFSAFFMAVQDTFYNKLIELLRMGFSMIFVIFIFILDLSSLQNFSYSWIIGLYIGIIFSINIFYIKYYKKYLINEKIIFDLKLYIEIARYAVRVILGTTAATILSQMDMQMIIYLLGTTDAGYYTNYLSIIGIPFLIIGPIFGFLFPVFSEMYGKGEIKKIKQIKQMLQKNLLAIGIAFNILFFISAQIIAFTLFGEKFIESGNILQYSILFLVFNFLLQINFYILAGIGKIKQRVKIISIALIFNFFMNILLIKYIGVYGAALATSFGWILIWILSEYYLGKEYYIKLNYKFLTKNIVLMGLLGLFYYHYIIVLFEGLTRINSFIFLFILGIIWFGIFTLINIKEFKSFTLEIKKLRQGK